MKRINIFKIILLSCFAGIIFTSEAQSPKTPLLEINGNSYSIDEFNYIFNKNNTISKNPISKKEYLNLFVNYKLKVIEAIAQGLDTMPNFKKELSYYRNELSKPYLMDKKATEEIAKEAYERMLEDVDVSHILIRLPKNPFPEDTLKAYKKISEIREKIIKGADFEALAIEHSEDPSVKANKGRLGFISVFQTVYPFETAAYNTPVGEISPIVRSSFGYHILKVNDKRKSRGEIKVAHIMVVVPRDAQAEKQKELKNKIDSIYQLLQDGGDFGQLAKEYSDDKNSAEKGGELNWFGTGRMIAEFADAAFAIPNNNEYSKPVRTRVGWHIIYKIDQRGIKPYKEVKEDIATKISNSERSLSGKTATIKRLKKENNFKADSSTIEFLKTSFSTPGISNQEFHNKLKDHKTPLCTINDTIYTLTDFSKYLKQDYTFKAGTSPLLLDKKLTDFFNNKLINYEKAHLEEKYPEFKFLMNEYYDGLLIFDISQKEIWNKASGDSIGLHKFFENNKEDYFTPEKFNGSIFFCKNKNTLRSITGVVKDSVTVQVVDSLKSILNKSFVYENGEYVKGEKPLYDAVLWSVKPKDKINYPENFSKTCYFGSFTKSTPQKFDDVKGLVIADYQTFIEKEWVDKLKEKYSPVLNMSVLKKSKR